MRYHHTHIGGPNANDLFHGSFLFDTDGFDIHDDGPTSDTDSNVISDDESIGGVSDTGADYTYGWDCTGSDHEHRGCMWL